MKACCKPSSGKGFPRLTENPSFAPKTSLAVYSVGSAIMVWSSPQPSPSTEWLLWADMTPQVMSKSARQFFRGMVLKSLSHLLHLRKRIRNGSRCGPGWAVRRQLAGNARSAKVRLDADNVKYLRLPVGSSLASERADHR